MLGKTVLSVKLLGGFKYLLGHFCSRDCDPYWLLIPSKFTASNRIVFMSIPQQLVNERCVIRVIWHSICLWFILCVVDTLPLDHNLFFFFFNLLLWNFYLCGLLLLSYKIGFAVISHSRRFILLISLEKFFISLVHRVLYWWVFTKKLLLGATWHRAWTIFIIFFLVQVPCWPFVLALASFRLVGSIYYFE